MRCFRTPRWFSGLCAAIAFLLLGSSAARAQPAPNQAAIDKLIEMNKRALRDYDAAAWNSARKTLLEAVSAGKKSGLEGHGIMARTYLHLGLMWVAGYKDKDKALWSFERALEIDPAIRIRTVMENPENAAIFEEAQRNVAAAAAAAPAAAPTESAPAATSRSGSARAGDTPVPSSSAGAPLDCPNSGEAPPDKPLTIVCSVGPGLKVATLHLFYRGPSKKKFVSIEMEKGDSGKYEGEVPEKVFGDGGAVQFYVEGRDGSGKPIVSNGYSGSPNIVLVREGVGEEPPTVSKGAAEEAVEENPLDESTMRRASVTRKADTRYGNRRFWIGIGGGSGAGYAKGDGLEARPDLQSQYEAGLGWAGLGHLAPEIGYHITPDIAVSVQGRVQWIPQPAKYQKTYSTGAQSVLARLLFFTKQQRLRAFGALMAGGGTGFRFTLHPDHTQPDVKDTVRGGPGIAGVGGGLSYELVKAISLVAEVNALAGIPVFSAVADLNLAFQINIY